MWQKYLDFYFDLVFLTQSCHCKNETGNGFVFWGMSALCWEMLMCPYWLWTSQLDKLAQENSWNCCRNQLQTPDSASLSLHLAWVHASAGRRGGKFILGYKGNKNLDRLDVVLTQCLPHRKPHIFGSCPGIKNLLRTLFRELVSG